MSRNSIGMVVPLGIMFVLWGCKFNKASSDSSQTKSGKKPCALVEFGTEVSEIPKKDLPKIAREGRTFAIEIPPGTRVDQQWMTEHFSNPRWNDRSQLISELPERAREVSIDDNHIVRYAKGGNSMIKPLCFWSAVGLGFGAIGTAAAGIHFRYTTNFESKEKDKKRKDLGFKLLMLTAPPLGGATMILTVVCAKHFPNPMDVNYPHLKKGACWATCKGN